MIRAHSFALLMTCVPALIPAASAPWHSTLFSPGWHPPGPSASFATDKIIQDFSYAGYHLGAETPPHVESPIFNTVADYGADPTGRTDSTNAIQDAIDAAGRRGGGVVFLPAGHYRLSLHENRSGVLRLLKPGIVLRGAGPGRTFLVNTSVFLRGKSIILAEGPSDTDWTKPAGDPVPITRDLLGPSTRIPVADTSGFNPGDEIVIRCNPTPEWIREHHEEEWIGHEARLGCFLYYRRILSVDTKSSELVIDVPTRYFLKTRDHPVVYARPGFLREVGVEDLSVGNIQHPGPGGWGHLDFAKAGTAGYDVHFSFAITFSRLTDSWIRNVNSFCPDENTNGTNLLSNGIRLSEARAVTVENCYFQRGQYGGGGGNGYMFRLDNSNECLFTRCIAEFARHGYSFAGMAASGNVMHRCIDRFTGRQTGDTGDEDSSGGKSSDQHMYFSHSNLIDSCEAVDSWFEARDRWYPEMSLPKHNTTSAHTVFWNIRGEAVGTRDYEIWRNGPFAVWSQQARYGYVIGTRGPVSAVKTDGAFPDRNYPTDPVDYVEGVGAGDSLVPSSLYDAQRSLRLGLGSPW